MTDSLKSNKIKGLEILKKKNIPVPDFSFIPDYSVFGVDYSALNPNFQLPIIKDYLVNIVHELGDSQYGYSVRSASFDEDEENISAAGRYQSYNCLKSIDEIYNTAIYIWKHHRSIAKKGVQCPLIIQKTHCSYYSGVLFRDSKINPVTTIIESYFGSCRTIVNGMVLPYRSTYKNNQWEHSFYPDKQSINTFICNTALFKDYNAASPGGSLLKPEHTPFPLQIRKYLDNSQSEIEVYGYRLPKPPLWYNDDFCNALNQMASNLDEGKGVDIEWGTDPDGKLYLYQFRALTRPILVSEVQQLESFKSQINTNVFKGLPGAPGVVKGYIALKQFTNLENTVLMLNQATIDNVKAIESSVAVVSSMGGMLSHLAIVCRELNKPCVVGIQTTIPDNTFVEVDGYKGIVSILS